MNDKIEYKPIGFIHSKYTNPQEMPKNYTESKDVEAYIELDEKYMKGISDLRIGDEYILLFHFHKSEGYDLTVPWRGVGPMRGLFSTHAPRRPNPIGVSIITVTKIEDNKIYFTGVDMLDGTPVLDIKNHN
ncbi:SAM-dependent methyltransferase [Methanosphaera sp.]|jgi:tRNA-Thr(GGU) m(6)t(6)A37 methyltransferase TsaA|uniref:SAM-dependent methyltransferase n=1 Tax=Methanosphaera sp. TaxID=2666342 RepID=UPI002A5425B3|nr:SAM-dependent methyltransferase [Methanobacteriaceae archaeon]